MADELRFVFLAMLHVAHPKPVKRASFIDVAGSEEKARQVFDTLTMVWEDEDKNGKVICGLTDEYYDKMINRPLAGKPRNLVGA